MRNKKEYLLNVLAKISPASYHAIGHSVIAPLLVLVIDYFLNSGNTDAITYVDSYIANSDTIQIVYPDIDKVEINCECYSDRYRHDKTYYMYTFYSNSLKKYISISMFAGVDFFNKEKREGDLGRMRPSYYIPGNVFLVRVNRIQLHDSQYGTKENPVPVFWYKFIKGEIFTRHFPDGTPYDPSHPNPFFLAQDTVTDEANKLFVTEYLTHFLPPKELERLFGKK